MKKLIFNIFIIVQVLLNLNSCSDNSHSKSDEIKFNGRTFVSTNYGNGKKIKLFFSEINNNLTANDIPWDVNFTKSYEILNGDESPSGKTTISVESWYYFIVKNNDELIYRYYQGLSEKTIILRALN